MSTKPVIKKGTPGTEAIIGQSVIALAKVSKDLKDAVSVVDTLATNAENLSAQIAEKEAQIVELNVTFAEKKRQAQITLDLDIQADANSKVLEVLGRQNKIAVPKDEYAELVEENSSLKDSVATESNKAAAIAKATAEKEGKIQLETQKLQFDAQKAQMVAELSQKDNQIGFLKEQIEFLKDSIDAERVASVDRAKASSVGSINITGTK